MRFEEIDFSGQPVMCEMNTGIPHPVLPTSFRRTVFQMLHGLAHPGLRATRRIITQRFLWAGVNKDVNRGMSHLSAGESFTPHKTVHPTTACSPPPFQFSTYRYCVPPEPIRRIHPPPDHHGQDYQMAGDPSTLRHLRQGMCFRSCIYVDIEVRGSRRPDI